MKRWLVLVHGGAGEIGELSPAQEHSYRRQLRRAVEQAAAILDSGGRSLEAVTAAVQALEECALFNAGRGSVRNRQGIVEMDAAVMDGASRRAGAVAAVRSLRNPVLAARLVAERSPHVLLVADGAEAFAVSHGAVRVPPEYFTSSYFGSAEDTVGAVALDVEGNLAAATSTGGTAGKLPGRVGDSPLIGAGTYADNRSCAVSTTGTGEHFIRTVAAYSIHARLLWGRLSLEEAARQVLQEIDALGGTGGLIALDAAGNAVALCTSPGMYRAMASSDGRILTAIWREEPWQES